MTSARKTTSAQSPPCQRFVDLVSARILIFRLLAYPPTKNSMHFYLHEREKLCKDETSCGYGTPPLPAMDSIKFAWKEERYKIYTIMP